MSARRRAPRAVGFVALLAFAALARPARPADLSEAFRRFDGADLDGARAQLEAILAAGAAEGERAAALNLLAAVATAEEDWTEAARLSEQVRAEFPGTQEAREAGVRLRLLRAIENAAAPTAHPMPVAPETARTAPSPAPRPGGRAEAAPEPPATPAVAADPGAVPSTGGAPPAPAPVSPPAQPGGVLAAGLGTPYDAVQKALARLKAFAAGHGVELRDAEDGVPTVIPKSQAVLPRLLEAVRGQGAAGLVLLEAQFGFRERVVVRCLAPDGSEAWAEKVTGSVGHTKIEMNPRLMTRIEERLAKRVGGPCLGQRSVQPGA